MMDPRGNDGEGLVAQRSMSAISVQYVSLEAAALARIAAGSSLAGDLAMPLTDLAAGCWIAGFLMFVIGYRRVLTGRGAKD